MSHQAEDVMPSLTPERETAEVTVHFTYFVVRLQYASSAVAQSDLIGVVERLGSGEKRGFASAGELVQLLRAWHEPPAADRGISMEKT